MFSGNLLYGTGSSARRSVVAERGRMGAGVGGRLTGEGIYIYVYVWLIHFTVQQKHNAVKQLYSDFFFFNEHVFHREEWRARSKEVRI